MSIFDKMTRPRATQWGPWLAPAAMLFATAWGSNQFAPLLLVYRHALVVLC